MDRFRFFTRKTALSCCVFLMTLNVAAAQGLTATNDTLRTGPCQTVRKNIISNDLIPGDYSWNLSVYPSTAQGTLTVLEDFVTFTPADNFVGNFDLEYELSGSGVTTTAVIHVIVSAHNNPVNVIDPDLKCVEIVPTGGNFSPSLKYIGKKENNGNYVSTDNLDGFSMPLVGDLNGDGKPEIVAMGMSNGGALDGTGNNIIIFNGQNGKEIYRYPLSNLGGSYSLRSATRHNSVSKLAIADLDKNGTGDIIVTETGTGGRVHCIEPVFNGATISGMTKKWTGWKTNTSTVASFKDPILSASYSTYGSPVPYIADINGDGTPEVIVYNKIYNGVTGELVCSLQTLNDFAYSSNTTTINKIINDYAYVGRRPGALWEDDHIPCMVIADVNGDEVLDIVAGSKVYIMRDNAGRPALDYIINGPSSVTAQRGTGASTNTTTYVTDGFTAVADIDLDGQLDVIVLAPAESGLDNSTENLLYVWTPLDNPATPKAAVYLYTSSYTGTMSYPFVGDINGRLDDFSGTKHLPEICFNGGRFYTTPSAAIKNLSQIAFHPLSSTELSSTVASSGFNKAHTQDLRGHIVGFTYHANPDGSTPMHQRLKLSWAMEHGDESSCTGITMFDFDNDNVKELCYRDEKSVRVISPARKVYIPNTEPVSATGAIRFKYTGIQSYTGFEAPVIADVNMDGSADIVTLVHNGPATASKGFVHVFEHASGSDQWAPCPPVWNQGIYFPLQINEDLTVPAKPQSMLTSYTDGSGTTIYPYNGQWIQQPVVKQGEGYFPQRRKPDAVLQNMTVKLTSTTTASVTLTVYNGGSASINANTPIAFYDGDVDGKTLEQSSLIDIRPIGIDIFPHEKEILTYDFSGIDLHSHLVWARIVDNGVSFPATGYLECEDTNNTFSGVDCPYLIYTVTAAPDTVLCGQSDNVLLTAVPTNSPQPGITPVYQWYRNDVPIHEADASTYTATSAGEYKCYVIENVCRGFSTNVITVARRHTADVSFAGTSTSTYYSNGDSLIVTLPVTNTGEAILTAPYYISTYGYTLMSSSQMATDSSAVSVAHGEISNVNVTVRNLSTSALDSIIFVANRRENHYVQHECDTANNSFVLKYESILMARNDYATTIVNSPVKVAVLKNDNIPSGYTPVFGGTLPSKHGSSIVYADSVVYTPDSNYLGYDTVAYSISSNGSASSAYIIVYVASAHDNISEADCYVEPEAQAWGIQVDWSSSGIVSSHMTPMVGDLDGDGVPEIVCWGTAELASPVASDVALRTILIYNGRTHNLVKTITLPNNVYMDALSGAAYGLVKAPFASDTVGIIVVACKDFLLRAYDIQGTLRWTSTAPYGSGNEFSVNIGFADFNADGYPEVYVRNKVYDVQTGRLLGTASGGNNTGSAWAHWSHNAATQWMLSSPIAADVTGDRRPELILGNEIYDVNITDRTSSSNSITRIRQITPPAGVVNDGHAQVADFNNDGYLDVFISNRTLPDHIATVHGYVWDVRNSSVSLPFAIPTKYSGKSIPLIADIDNDRKLDVLIQCGVASGTIDGRGELYRYRCYEYDSSTESFDFVWDFYPDEDSFSNTATMFDFNLDGVNEILLTDQSRIRILNAATGVEHSSFNFIENTFMQYPVIADVDGDGNSEVVAVGSNQLNIFKSSTGTPWAPSRRVWNQYMYNAVNINEDLTVPTVLLNPATVLPGADGYIGTADDVRPYNNFLQQQTTLNRHGTPYWPAPDAIVDSIWIESLDATNTRVYVRIGNRGYENVSAMLPVALYASSTPSSSKFVAQGAINDVIAPSEKKTIFFDILTSKLEPQMSVRLQDSNGTYPADGYLDCNLGNNTGIFSSLLAVRDLIVMKPGDSIVFDVRDNDYFGACGKGAMDAFDTIALNGPKHGTLVFNPVDSTYKYRPHAGFRGVDSIAYYIKCGVDSSAAKVYILVHKPLSLQYSACPGASITIGFSPAAGVQYYWHTAQTDGTVEHSNVNSLTLTVSTEKIWWVEPRYKQIKFPRHNVRLSISQYCASLDAAGCSATGTLIYKEDFGGNNVSDPQYSSTALAQGLVDLVFCPNGGCVSPTYGYMFAKTLSSIHKHIEKIGGGDDHSAWNDKTHGYFMSIDPAANNMNYKVYGSIIKGLCTGTNLSFTLWAYDWHQEAASEARPKIEMLIRDARTMDTIITSGIITLHRENPAQNHVVWRQYGFDFSIPAGVDSVLFTIVNKEVSNIGNDWFLDDIEIRLCAPKVNMNILRSDTSVCFGNALDIIGTYLSDCTFGNELECRWEFRHVDSARWKVVTPAQANVLLADCSVPVPISKTLSITSANKVDEGYYRLYMSSPAGIGNANCRAASDSIYVKVIDRYAAPDIRIQTCAAPQNRQMQLSAYLDSTDYNSIRWEKISPFAPDIIDDEKGMINGTFAKDVIYKYKYTAKAPEESGCGSTSAIAYIKAQDGNVAAKIDTVAICCSGMDMNKYIQISSIFGLEFDGTFDYGSGTQAGNPDNTVANNVRVFGAPSKYHGALVFDAKKAYSEADAGYDIIYKGTNAKKFNFLYTGNCIPYKKRIVLIVIP